MDQSIPIDENSIEDAKTALADAVTSASSVLSKAVKKSMKDGSSEFKRNFQQSLDATIQKMDKGFLKGLEHMGQEAVEAGEKWARTAEGALSGAFDSGELKQAGMEFLKAMGLGLESEFGEAIMSAVNNMELEEARKEFQSSTEQGISEALSGLPSNSFTKAIGIDAGIAAGAKAFTTKFAIAGAKVGRFIAQNWKLALGAALAIAVFAAIDDATNEIGDAFGAVGVTNFKTDLMDAKAEFVEMGMSAEDLSTTINTLSADFGMSVDAAINLSGEIADTSKALGLSAAEGSKLVGLLTTSVGLSSEQAQNFMKGAEMMAVTAGVAPGVIMKDIAEASEDLAAFSKDGGENIARAAVQARKLGISLSDSAKMARGLLNFQESLNAEMEASVMLGRDVNLQKARQLALEGDIAGATAEVLKQVGSAAEFERMNVLEKEALAAATGLTVEQLSKFVNLQGKSNAELKRTSDYDISKVVGDKAIGNVQQFKNDMEAAKIQVLSMISGIATLGGLLDDGPSWLVALNVGLITLGAYLLFTVGRTLMQSLANRILAKSIDKVTDAEIKRQEAGAGDAKGGGFLKSLGKGMTGLLKGAAALLIIAGAMFVFGAALQYFAEVNWANVFIGIGALVLLGVVAAVLGYFAPITMIGAQVMLILAASMLVLGIAAMAFGMATQLMMPFLEFMVNQGTALFFPLLSFAMGLYVLLPALILLGITVAYWFPALVALSLGMGLLGVGLAVASVGMQLFNQQMQVMIDNTDEMAQTTIAVIGFAGALFLLAAALGAVGIAGALALPTLMGVGLIGGFVLGAMNMGGKEEEEGGSTRDLYDQLVLMNERLAVIEESFEKNWIPKVVESNIEGAKGAEKGIVRSGLQKLGF